MISKKKYIIDNVNLLKHSNKKMILNILCMYQYEKHLKEGNDGIRIDISLIKNEHIDIIFNNIFNIVNGKNE